MQFYDYRYTNCFAINVDWGSAKQNHVKFNAESWNVTTDDISRIDMVLNLNASEFTPLENAKSVRISVHPPEKVPNPAYYGVSLQPGYETHYTIGKQSSILLPAPYSTNCKRYFGINERRTNATQTREASKNDSNFC